MIKCTLLFRMVFGLFLTVAFFLAEAPNTSAKGNRPGRGPAEDPPAETVPAAEFPGPSEPAGPPLGAPIREWTFHKTADGAHPDGREQQVLWLMNRARANPPAEGVWLATAADPDIAGGRDYFGVNTTVLQTEFNGYGAKPPAAFRFSFPPGGPGRNRGFPVER